MADKCNHPHYRQAGYMQYGKAMKDNNICWVGMIEETCVDCGEDISKYRLVKVMTADQYRKSLK